MFDFVIVIGKIGFLTIILLKLPFYTSNFFFEKNHFYFLFQNSGITLRFLKSSRTKVVGCRLVAVQVMGKVRPSRLGWHVGLSIFYR